MEGLAASRIERCQDAADVAHQLIAYCANKGFAVEEADYRAVFEVLNANDPSTLLAEQEFKFWVAYSNLANKIEPGLDPLGIYYTRLFETGRSAGTSKTAEKVRRRLVFHSYAIMACALLALILLIVLLAYGSILEATELKIVPLQDERSNLLANNLSATRFKDIPNATCPNFLTSPCIDYRTTVFSEIRVAAGVLQDLLPFDTVEKAPKDYLPEDIERIRTYAKQMIVFLGSYVYPLLAGGLGASVYLIRMIFINIGSLTLTMRTFSASYLRIAVGTIAGIVVGWLAGGEPERSISLTPLALAFVAGYAVEVIYAILDRIVAAFTQPEVPKPQS